MYIKEKEKRKVQGKQSSLLKCKTESQFIALPENYQETPD